jgi:hypothetical protein
MKEKTERLRYEIYTPLNYKGFSVVISVNRTRDGNLEKRNIFKMTQIDLLLMTVALW